MVTAGNAGYQVGNVGVAGQERVSDNQCSVVSDNQCSVAQCGSVVTEGQSLVSKIIK